VKDSLDLAIGVAIGLSMQVALFIAPLTVLVAWPVGSDMSLFFDPFQTIVLYIAIL